MTDLLQRVLVVLGAGFLVANLRLLVHWARSVRLKPSAVLTWTVPHPRYFRFFVLLAVVLSLLVFVKLALLRLPFLEYFGELMMLTYYGVMAPLTLRIGRGFYEEGVWVDGGFLRYEQIGGIAWKEGAEPTLLFMPRSRPLAHRLTVPQHLYGAVRRELRDRIAQHAIRFSGEGLDLGHHDEREDV